MARSWPVHLAGWPYLDSFSHHQIASPSVLQGHWKNLRAGSANFGRPRRSKAPVYSTFTVDVHTVSLTLRTLLFAALASIVYNYYRPADHQNGLTIQSYLSELNSFPSSDYRY
ncbi:hypothetical protein DTO027B5_644 [Paecilomyces variotii]|nr:hypothetical protein DTO027B3_6157 [Paecilomyces variotii]KAJ9337823.1 hypothetical protein DTO027B5_644 [Paecilomyces variotii]KAJ9360298.1 hypothetical protein DTO027B9_1282 [Paecilomyces variotii]